MSSKVYVVQEPYRARDFSSAAKYGSIHFIFSMSDNPSLTPTKAKFKIRQALKDFNPEMDYIVMAGGDPINGLLVGSILQTFNIKKYKFLRWERTRNLNGESTDNGFYVPVEIDLLNY